MSTLLALAVRVCFLFNFGPFFQNYLAVLKFDEKGDTATMGQIDRYTDRGDARTVVGYYDPVYGDIDWIAPLTWMGGRKPIDFPVVVQRKEGISSLAYTVCVCVYLSVCM